jgi:hypothetical protein
VGRRYGLRFMVVPGHGQGEVFVDGHCQVYTKNIVYHGALLP